MLTSRNSITIDAPIERVWARLTDYAGYAHFPHFESARVLERGSGDPAGVGAVRELRVGGVRFVERIVEFDPPHRLGYEIVECGLRNRIRENAVNRLVARGGQTDVTWDSTVRVDIPVIGGALTHVVRFGMSRMFGQILRWLKSDLERGTRPDVD